MRIAGNATLHAPVEAVYQALKDPRVLVRTIPGCERLEQVGDDAYAMTVTAGVALGAAAALLGALVGGYLARRAARPTRPRRR